jgi:plastocyanin
LNRPLTSVGLLLALFGTFLFYGVFTDLTPGFVAMLVALVLVPIGSGIAFYGAAFSGSYAVEARAVGGGGGATSGMVWAALGVAVVAILLAVASLSVAFSAQSGANDASTKISQVNGNVTALNATLAAGGVPPQAVAVKVDWCNTDPTTQDRFCPNEIVVNQGDVVQLMFISNDTDAHTFTLLTSPYLFQINDSVSGMRNFLNNATIPGTCSNGGTFALQSANVSGIYCVSGGSLLSSAAAGNFRIAQNPTPANPGSPGGISLVVLPVDNMLHIANFSADAGVAEVYGIGAFRATTPGIYEFFCHYHVSNGMFGYLIVLPNPYCSANPTSCGAKP